MRETMRGTAAMTSIMNRAGCSGAEVPGEGPEEGKYPMAPDLVKGVPEDIPELEPPPAEEEVAGED